MTADLRTRARDAAATLDRLHDLLVWVADLELLDAPAGRRGLPTDPPRRPRPRDGLAAHATPHGYVEGREQRRGDPDVRGCWLRTETLVAQAHAALVGTQPTGVVWGWPSPVVDGDRRREPLPARVVLPGVVALRRQIVIVSRAPRLGGVHAQRLRRSCAHVAKVPGAWKTWRSDWWDDPRGTVHAGHHVPLADPRCSNDPCPDPCRRNGKGGYGAECSACHRHRAKHGGKRPVSSAAS